jgi:hypothetical protein
MPVKVSPLHLVRDKSVQLKIVRTRNSDPIAFVFDDRKTFTITMNEPGIEDLWAKAWLNKNVPLEDFKTGILIHEVAHVLYRTLSIKPTILNKFWKYCFNCLADAQIEYQMSMDHPSLVYYIRVVISSLWKKIDEDSLKPLGPDESQLVADMSLTFFYLTRFGVIHQVAQPEWVEFFLPIIASCMRGEIENVEIGTRMVYEYFMGMLSPEGQKVLEQAIVIVEATSMGEIEGAMEMDRMMQSTLFDAVQEIAKQNSQQAGKSNHVVEIDEKESAFWRATIEKHATSIKGIRAAFKRHLNQLIPTPSFEGDLLLDPYHQQQAYVNSFTMEEEQNYTVLKRKATSLDLVTWGDISGSTSGIQKEYAEARVAILAYVANMPGIRTASGVFSDTSAIALDFDKPVRQGRFDPQSAGGTQLVPALDQIAALKWMGLERLCFIITDGYIYDMAEAQKKMALMKAKYGITFVLYDIGGNSGSGIKHTTIDQLPKVIAQDVLAKL